MTTSTRIGRAAAVLAVVSLAFAACGDDDDDTAGTGSPEDTAGGEETAASAPATTAAPGTTAGPGTTAAPGTTAGPGTTAAPGTTAPESTGPTGTVDPTNLDTNGDGVVQFGVAAAGPRDDGAYYQALVTKVEQFSEANGFEAPIIVDNITAEDAAAELANIAEQGVDVITVGASEIADPLADLVEQYSEIFWYCNCGAGYPENPGLAQSQDDASEINYTAGYATGLLLQESGGDSVAFIGCCDLGFEKESYMAYELGLQAVDPSFTMTYIPTGNFPFDFDNTAGATEALNNALAEGADAVYPFLGGAHEPLVQLANEAGIIAMSAGSSTACERDDLDYQIQVRFDAGDYLDPILAEIASGEFQEGDVRVFHVGVDPQPGAEICDPTPEQQTAMDEVYGQVAAGEFAEQFGAIKGEAYAGG
jgi:basic membrane protein A